MGRRPVLSRPGHRPGRRGHDRDRRAGTTAGRGAFRADLRGVQDHPDHAPGRRVPPARVPHHGGLARAAPVPQGGLPGLGALDTCDLRDPARPHRAADRDQHELGSGEVRGLRAPLGGPERVRATGSPSSTTASTATTYAVTPCGSPCSAARGFPIRRRTRGSTGSPTHSLPHSGDLRAADGVVQQAEFFNLPLSLVAGRTEGRVVTIDRPGVSVEAVKWADRSDAIVVRVCEVWGSTGTLPGDPAPPLRVGEPHRPARARASLRWRVAGEAWSSSSARSSWSRSVSTSGEPDRGLSSSGRPPGRSAAVAEPGRRGDRGEAAPVDLAR